MSEPSENAASNKPPCSPEDALAVLRRLRQQGHVAYFAGGCVRDLLMGREPKDWDVATDAPPGRVRELFSQTQAVGAAFGVILVKHRASTVEVATFRTEGAYSDGRRPDAVAFATAAEDAQRRDFTINGLFLDPEKREAGVETPHGTVIDFVGGLPDLRARVLRAIGEPDRRFAEDHLRLLRAVRFASRFGLEVEPQTAAAIRVNAPKLRGISPERIADELRRMLTPVTRAVAWPMLWRYALVDVIFRFLPSGEAAEFDPARSLFLRAAPGRPVSFALALAAGVLDYRLMTSDDLPKLLGRKEVHAVGRAMREALRVSNEELDAMLGILESLGALLAEAAPPAVAAKKRFLARATAGESRELLRAIAALGMSAGRIGELDASFDDLLSLGDVAPLPLITGDDLVAMGMKPGPLFRRILDSVYDAQLETRVVTRDEAMAMARRMGTSGPGSG